MPVTNVHRNVRPLDLRRLMRQHLGYDLMGNSKGLFRWSIIRIDKSRTGSARKRQGMCGLDSRLVGKPLGKQQL